MLPAWATVAISLGASAITAVAAFSGAWLQGHRDRERQLRDLVVSSAHDFATGILQAAIGVRDALEAPARTLADTSAIWAAEPHARELVDEAEARLARVHILLKPDSAVGKAAQEAVDDLRAATDALLPALGTDVDAASDRVERARAHLHAFEKEAGTAIRKPARRV